MRPRCNTLAIGTLPIRFNLLLELSSMDRLRAQFGNRMHHQLPQSDCGRIINTGNMSCLTYIGNLTNNFMHYVSQQQPHSYYVPLNTRCLSQTTALLVCAPTMVYKPTLHKMPSIHNAMFTPRSLLGFMPWTTNTPPPHGGMAAAARIAGIVRQSRVAPCDTSSST